MHIKTKQKTQSPFKTVLKVDKNEKVTFCKKLQYLLEQYINFVDFGEQLVTRESICGHFWSGR